MKWKIEYGTLGLVALVLAAGLVWYHIVDAPVPVSAELTFSEVPVLHAYPELEGVRINPNTATAEQLQQLPNIGPARAEAIRDYVATYGNITTAEQMLEIDGIGESVLEGMRPYLIFE